MKIQGSAGIEIGSLLLGMSHGPALIVLMLSLGIQYVQLLLMYGGGHLNLKHVLRHTLWAILG
jgi:hypothetical protein